MDARKKLYHNMLEEMMNRNIDIDFTNSLDTLESKEMIRQLYKVDSLRHNVCCKRLKASVESKKLQTYDGNMKDISQDTGRGLSTIEHNLEGVFNDLSSARSSRLIKPLSCLEAIRPLALNNRRRATLQDIDIEINADLLCIGPRTEAEILLLWAYGFTLEQISAIDLISYSDLVQLGDMHSLPFPDNKFDVIFCACTLPYSKNPKAAIREMQRVAKPGAVFAIMLDIEDNQYRDFTFKQWGYHLAEPNDIISLFDLKHPPTIHYQHYCDKNLNIKNGSTSAVIFS